MPSEWLSIPETLHRVDFDRKSGKWDESSRIKAEISVGQKLLSATLVELAPTLIHCPSAGERGWWNQLCFHAVCFAASSPQLLTLCYFIHGVCFCRFLMGRECGHASPARNTSQRRSLILKCFQLPAYKWTAKPIKTASLKSFSQHSKAMRK